MEERGSNLMDQGVRGVKFGRETVLSVKAGWCRDLIGSVIVVGYQIGLGFGLCAAVGYIFYYMNRIIIFAPISEYSSNKQR